MAPAPKKTAAKKKAAPAVRKAAAKPAAKPAARKTAAKAAAPAKPKPMTGPMPAIVTLKHLAEWMGVTHAIPKKQAVAMLTGFVGDIGRVLKKGSKIRIPELGILQVRHRPARMGRNPATGEQIKIKASKKVAFRVAKSLKDAI
jgi:DNA-binding protein HU-beta